MIARQNNGHYLLTVIISGLLFLLFFASDAQALDCPLNQRSCANATQLFGGQNQNGSILIPSDGSALNTRGGIIVESGTDEDGTSFAAVQDPATGTVQVFSNLDSVNADTGAITTRNDNVRVETFVCNKPNIADCDPNAPEDFSRVDPNEAFGADLSDPNVRAALIADADTKLATGLPGSNFGDSVAGPQNNTQVATAGSNGGISATDACSPEFRKILEDRAKQIQQQAAEIDQEFIQPPAISVLEGSCFSKQMAGINRRAGGIFSDIGNAPSDTVNDVLGPTLGGYLTDGFAIPRGKSTFLNKVSDSAEGIGGEVGSAFGEFQGAVGGIGGAVTSALNSVTGGLFGGLDDDSFECKVMEQMWELGQCLGLDFDFDFDLDLDLDLDLGLDSCVGEALVGVASSGLDSFSGSSSSSNTGSSSGSSTTGSSSSSNFSNVPSQETLDMLQFSDQACFSEFETVDTSSFSCFCDNINPEGEFNGFFTCQLK